MDFELIFADILAATDKALLLEIEGEEFWVPRSQIEDGHLFTEFCNDTEFQIKTWFCKKEGLI